MVREAPDKFSSDLSFIRSLKGYFAPTVILVLSDDAEFVAALRTRIRFKFIIITSKKEKLASLASDKFEICATKSELRGGMDYADFVRENLIECYISGKLSNSDRVLAIGLSDGTGTTIHFVDMALEKSLVKLKKELEYRADMNVFENTLKIASELAREGREGKPIGALFVLGDSARVLKHSRQIVINPFKGHPHEDRLITDQKNHETAKEFSQIDGAMIISDKGIIEAAGRYLDVKRPVDIPSGLGGRHLAAAAITSETRAIAVVVSMTGTVRVFKDGEIVLRLAPE